MLPVCELANAQLHGQFDRWARPGAGDAYFMISASRRGLASLRRLRAVNTMHACFIVASGSPVVDVVVLDACAAAGRRREPPPAVCGVAVIYNNRARCIHGIGRMR